MIKKLLSYKLILAFALTVILSACGGSGGGSSGGGGNWDTMQWDQNNWS